MNGDYYGVRSKFQPARSQWRRGHHLDVKVLETLVWQLSASRDAYAVELGRASPLLEVKAVKGEVLQVFGIFP